jgi:hypothetical protein
MAHIHTSRKLLYHNVSRVFVERTFLPLLFVMLVVAMDVVLAGVIALLLAVPASGRDVDPVSLEEESQ